ncbi:hypothetical protein [Acaryochloris sp. CCMEE 5410]|uniref:hypothetical protein n=1 Tax=Acaryochloris sp. CCMEE 5410 TaxID=310037 RepID=UPI0002484609|nr:hypothetical protein [Acaryochloris sp. CCMEE 5410]KAI9132223.1 hypothetical protein ON05_001695 [Acaryochloris sp. CCMEE 5410]
MDVNSGQGHQSPSEEIPSSDSLGLQHPLLPPPALGQSFLQPHTLSPLGAVSLINLDTRLPTEAAWTNSLGSQLSNQVPGEAIGNSSTGNSNISDSFVTQSPETQPNTLAPKVPTESLQPKLEQTPSNQRLSSAQNNPGKIDSYAASTPKVQQAPSLETGAVVHNDQPQISAPSIQPAQDREQETRERPVTKQAESGTQIAQERNSPEITLQPKLDKAQKFSPPYTKSHLQQLTTSSIPSPIENTHDHQKSSEMVSEQAISESKQKPEQTLQPKLDPASQTSPPPTKSHLQQSTLSPVSYSQDETVGDQTSSKVVSKQTISESKQKPEQTANPTIHSTTKAIPPEVSTSAEAPDGSPLQAKHQDILETKVASEPSIIQESLPQSYEQSTSLNSEFKSSGPRPSPTASATNDDPSPTQDSVISAPHQPSLQKVPVTNDHSLVRSAQTTQVTQSKEASLPTVSPPSSQKTVISVQPSPEPQVSSTQPNESQSASIQTSLEATAQSNKEVATKSSQQGTDTSTDLLNSQPIESQSISIQTSLETTAHSEQVNTTPSKQGTNSNTAKPASETIQSSPIPPNGLQQLSLTNSKEDANPSSSTDSSSSIETPITSSPPTIPRGKSIETTPIEQAAQASPQQSLDEKPFLLEDSTMPSSTAQSSESQTDTAVIQKIESSAAQQSSTDHLHTSKIETNQTSPTSSPPASTETPPTPSTTKKTDGNATRATVIQRADEPSPEASTKATSKQQKKQNKKNKQKKIPLQARLSRVGERAKQDIHKVGIQLKQASHSFPTGQSKAKVNGLQKSTGVSPQPSNPPSIQTKSFPDSTPSPPEVPLVQSEVQALAQASPQESAREDALPEKTEIANHEQNSPMVQAVSDSEDSPQKHPHATPATSELTINQDIQSDSVTDLQKKTESASNSTITGQHRNNSESSTPEISVNQLKTTSSPSATSSAGTETSRPKTKKWGQLPAHPLKRLTHLSQQVMDTVSRQLEPYPNEEFNPFQKQEQNLPKNSNQKREDQTISPVSLHRSVNGDSQPLQDIGSEDKSAATSIQSDIQAKSYSPNTSLGTASPSKPELSSDEQAHPNNQTDHHTDVNAEDHLQTQELPTVQKAEDSQSSSPSPPQSEQVNFPTSNSIETSSPEEGHSSASVVESQTNAPIPEWQLIQNQLADRITNLGSEIRQRVDRSILKQNSRRKSPQPTQINETDSAQIATSSGVAQTDQPLNSVVPELNGENIQATTESIADPVNGIEQPSLTASEQLTSTSDAVTESLVQTETSSVVSPSQEDISHPQAFTTEPSIQSSSVDKAKTPEPQQDSGQDNPALLHENEGTIQRDSAEASSSSSEQPITNVSSQSSANFGTAIPEASQSRDRNRPFNSPISKLGTTIVQQLTNLKPKKHKSKTKAKKQKSVSSPAQMSRETTKTDSTTSLNVQAKPEKTAQSTEHPNSPEKPNANTSGVAKQAVSTTSMSDAIQRQDIAPQQSSTPDSSDDSNTSTTSSSHPLSQAERSIQRSTEFNEAPGVSGKSDPSGNPDSLIQRETIQEQSQPEQPESQTQPLLTQNVLETESPVSERPPISEISIQTKVEQPSATDHPQLPTSPTSSVHKSSQNQEKLSSESSQSNLQESSEVVLDVNTSRMASQNLASPNVQASQIKEQDDNIPLGTSPTIQAQENPLEEPVSESLSVPSTHVPAINSDNTALDSARNSKDLESQKHHAPQAPIKSSDVSSNVLEKEGNVQRKIEAHIDSDLPFVPPREDVSNASKPSNAQPKISEASILGETSAQTEPHTAPSNLESKQASTVPIQAVEISVVQPATELQPTKDNLGQSFDNCDRTPESPLESGDKLKIQPTPEIQPIEQPDQQQAVPNRDSETAPTTDKSLANDVAKATTESTLQASSIDIEQSPDSSAAPTDISATSEIIQPKHQSHIGSELKTDPDLSTSQTQANPTLSAEPTNTDTPTPDLQKHPTDNLGESPPENVERIQSQPDQIDSPNRRIIEIPAQHPDGNIEKANLSDQDISSSSSLEIIENQSLQRNSEANSSLTEENLDPVNPKPSSNIAEQSQVSALPQADSSLQKVEHIQPQPDQIDSPHRRIIEIPAKRPDENLANDNLHPKDSASSSSSDLHEDPILQRTVESNSSLVETDLDRANRDISSPVGETSEVAELPAAKSDSKLQPSEADSSDSSLTSVQPLSTSPLKPTIQHQAQAEDTLNSRPQPIDPVDTQSGSRESLQRRVIEIAAQPPEPKQPEGNSPDLTVAQLLATGQSPTPLSNIADNFVSPKLISNLLPSSQPNRKHHSQKLRDFQNPNAPLQRKADDETGWSSERYEINTEDAIAPTIPSSSNPALPSNWSSIEDLFTTRSSVIQPKAEKTTATPEDTSDLVLTPTGIHPEKQVQRKTAFTQRTAQPLQKSPTTAPPISSTPEMTEVVMRQSQAEKSTEPEVDEQSFEILAREIYHVLRQRLEVERERHGGYQSGRLPW